MILKAIRDRLMGRESYPHRSDQQRGIYAGPHPEVIAYDLSKSRSAINRAFRRSMILNTDAIKAYTQPNLMLKRLLLKAKPAPGKKIMIPLEYAK